MYVLSLTSPIRNASEQTPSYFERMVCSYYDATLWVELYQVGLFCYLVYVDVVSLYRVK